MDLASRGVCAKLCALIPRTSTPDAKPLAEINAWLSTIGTALTTPGTCVIDAASGP